MKHEREFDTSYFHNPHVQRVNYSLFIMLLKEMVSMESKSHNWEQLWQHLPSYPWSLQICMESKTASKRCMKLEMGPTMQP
jgi:hypothetical protein